VGKGFIKMPIDEEQPDFALDIRNDAERSFQSMLMSASAAGAMSFLEAMQTIPFGIGSALTELATDLAFKRTNQHMLDMFEHFTNRIREIGEAKIDRGWFKSEEFPWCV
jgi:hypothetical protein